MSEQLTVYVDANTIAHEFLYNRDLFVEVMNELGYISETDFPERLAKSLFESDVSSEATELMAAILDAFHRLTYEPTEEDD